MPKNDGSLFLYERMYDWFSNGREATPQEIAKQFKICENTARMMCNYVARKFRVPLYALDGVYKIWEEPEDLERLSIKRASDTLGRITHGLQISVDTFVEVVMQLPPGEQEKYFPRIDLFASTARYLISLAGSFPQLDAPSGEV